MSRIKDKFAALQKRGERALVAYLTAGDPSLKITEELCLALANSGVDILEIGVPFSDPTADGPVIQAAALRALKNGTTLEQVLAMAHRITTAAAIPCVLFGYYNPIFSFGCPQFALRSKEAGIDGVLIVDLPPEEAAELRRETDPCGIDFINLIAPTTTDDRISTITSQATGFLYYISIMGITGTKKPEVADIRKDVARIRKISDLPVVAGFGISTPAQAAEIAPHADGVVVGSAFVKMISENSGRKDLVAKVARYAAEIKKAIR